MQPISKELYERLGGLHRPTELTTEKAWYVHDTLLGIILLDNVDNDWSFVSLAADPRRPQGMLYRAFDVGVNYKTFDKAYTALKRALAAGPEPEFYTEEV
jgi:hypothetical protein